MVYLTFEQNHTREYVRRKRGEAEGKEREKKKEGMKCCYDKSSGSHS